MRRKLWPKAPANGGVLGQISTNLKIFFTHINISEKSNKKFDNTAKLEKKMETEK